MSKKEVSHNTSLLSPTGESRVDSLFSSSTMPFVDSNGGSSVHPSKTNSTSRREGRTVVDHFANSSFPTYTPPSKALYHDPEGGSLRVTPTSIVQVPWALRHAEGKRTPLFQESGSSSDTPHTITHENSDASTAFDKQSTVQYVRTSEKNGFESDNSPFKREATERCTAEFPWDGCCSPDDQQLRLNVLTPLERPMEQHASGDLGKLNALSSFDGKFNFFKPIVMSSGKKPNEAPSEERDVSGTLPRNLTQSMTNTFVSPAGANNAADDDPLSPLSPHRCSTSVFSGERYERMKRNTLTPTAAVRHPLSGFSLVSQAKPLEEPDGPLGRSISPVEEAAEEEIDSCPDEEDTASFMNSCTNFFNSGVLYTPERELECTFTYKDRLPYSERMQQGRRDSKEDETSEAAEATPNKTATPLTPRTPVNCMAPHSNFDMTPLKSPARVYTPRYMDADLTPQKTIRRSNMQSQRQTPMTFNLKVMNMSLEGATNMKHQNVSALNVSLDPVNTSTVHQTVLHGVSVERDYFPPSRNPFSKFRMYETPYTLSQDYLSKEKPNGVLPLRADAAIVLSEQTLLQPKCNPLQTQIQCHPNCSEPAYSNQTFSEERNTRNSSSISGGSPGKCAEVLFGKREHDTSEKHSPLDTEYGISQSPSAARDTKSSSFPVPAADLWGRRWSDFSDGVQSRTLDEYSAILAHPPGSVVKQKQNSPFSTETELRFMDSNTPSTPAVSPDDVKNRTGESTSSDDRRPHEAAVLSKPLFSSFEEDEEEGKEKVLHLSKPPMWSPATASARHYASAPVAKHLVPNLEKYPNSSDNTFIEEEILFPATSSSVGSPASPTNFHSTRREIAVPLTRLSCCPSDRETPLPERHSSLSIESGSKQQSSGSSRQLVFAEDNREDESYSIDAAEEDFMYHLQRLGTSTNSRATTPHGSTCPSSPPLARCGNSLTTPSKATNLSGTNARLSQSKNFYCEDSNETFLSEDEIGLRFTEHHLFQFMHYIPNPTTDAIDAFFLPISVDPSGVSWLVTHRLDGAPYCCKEILDNNMAQLKVELEVFTMTNHVETLHGRLSYAFIARYHGCYRLPFVSLYSETSHDTRHPPSAYPLKRFVHLLHYEYFPSGTLFEWAVDPFHRRSTANKGYCPLAEKEWCHYVEQGLIALLLLHERDTIHGNPQSFNYYIYKKNHLKLSNFGSCVTHPSCYPCCAPHYLRPVYDVTNSGQRAPAFDPYESDVYVFCKSILLLLFHCHERTEDTEGADDPVKPYEVEETMLGRFDDFLHSLGEKDDDESIAGCPLRLAQLLLQATRTPIHVDGLLSAFYRLESIEKQEAYESNKNAFLGAVLEDLMVNEMYDAEIDRLFEEYNVLLKEKEATSGNVLTAGHASPPIGKPLPGPSPYKVGRRGSTSPLESDALFDESTESHRVGKPALDASFSSNASSRYMQPFFFPAPPVASGKESSIKVSVSEEPTSSLPAHAERATGEASPLTSILVTRPHRPSVDVNGSVKADRSRKESINSLTTWRAVPVDTSTVKEHSPSTNNVNSLRQSDMNSLRQSLGASRKNSIFDESKRYVQTVLQRYTAVTSGETDDEESERQNVLMREWIVQQIGILMQWNTLDAMNTPIHEIIEGGSPLRFRGARPLTSLE